MPAQRIRRPAGAELVASLGLLKVPARELKRALEEAAAVRADPPSAPHRVEWFSEPIGVRWPPRTSAGDGAPLAPPLGVLGGRTRTAAPSLS